MPRCHGLQRYDRQPSLLESTSIHLGHTRPQPCDIPQASASSIFERLVSTLRASSTMVTTHRWYSAGNAGVLVSNIDVPRALAKMIFDD